MIQPLSPARDPLLTRVKLSLRLLHRAARYRLKLNPLELKHLLPHLPKDGIAIDAGAHKGAYTWWFARAVGPQGLVLAFEPQPHLANHTARAAAALGLQQIKVYSAGLSDKSGHASLAYLDSTTHGATLNGLDLPDTQHRTIPTIAIDDLQLQALDVLKVDVEGHEQPVLKGAINTIQRFQPALLIEIESRLHDDGQSPVDEVRSLLEPMGYEGFFFTRERMSPISDFNPAQHQTYGQGHYSNNFLFTRPAQR